MTLGEWVKQYRHEHGLSMQGMADLCSFSKAYIGMLESGINPTTGKQLSPKFETFERIARAVGLDVNTLIDTLDPSQPITIGRENGLIYEAGSADISRSAASAIPIIGTIAAGIPIEAQQDIQGHVVPDERIRATFALRIKGNSMVNANINDGDIVFIRQQESVEDGEIAAVYVDGEATLKKFYRHDGAIELRPANDNMRSMFFTGDNCREFKVLGKCVGYMHGFE